MKKTLAVAALVGASMMPQQANAAMVTVWEYEVVSSWTGSSFTPGGGDQTTNDTELSWGAEGGDHELSGVDPLDARSALVISNTPGTGLAATNGPFEPTNSITHFNNAISNTFATLATAQLTTSLTLTPFLPNAFPSLPTDTLIFDINFFESPNVKDPLTNEDCGFESVSRCDDIFVVAFGDLQQSFPYMGYIYTVSIVELSGNLGTLTADQCEAAGAEAGCVGVTTLENAATPLNFAIAIAAVPVPEPTSMVLLGMGLLGAGVLRRRRA